MYKGLNVLKKFQREQDSLISKYEKTIRNPALKSKKRKLKMA